MRNMKETGIIFSGDMVKAILSGKKDQTRRPIIPQPIEGNGYIVSRRCPYGVIGDRLWVRETWAAPGYDNVKPSKIPLKSAFIFYKASHEGFNRPDRPFSCKWRPSIFMPRWACRILLEITYIRPERLADISGKDCLREGVKTSTELFYDGSYLVGAFRSLWDGIYKSNPKKAHLSFDNNPYVWVITFRVLEADI